MLKEKQSRTVNIVFLIIKIYIDCAAEFLKNAKMTAVHRMDIDMVSKVVSQSYDQS